MRKIGMVWLLSGLAIAGAACETEGPQSEISFRPGSEGDPDICAGCQLQGNLLDLWIDRAYEAEQVTGITLHLDDGDGVHEIEIGARELSSSRRTRITLDRDELPDEVVEAGIAIAFAGRGAPAIQRIRLLD